MTRQITLELEEQLLDRAIDLAASNSQSISVWINGLIDDAVRRRANYDMVSSEAILALKEGYDLGGDPISRESLHER